MTSLDTESVVAQARALWRDASSSAKETRVELYAKLAERVRIERRDASSPPSFHRALETGVAIRTMRPLERGAGFAAASGFSRDAIAWVVRRSLAREIQVPAESPVAVAEIPEVRCDLDPEQALPPEAELRALAEDVPSVDWVEAGTTTEVLIGTVGWIAVRRRHRLWAMMNIDGPRLVARRGFVGWARELREAIVDVTRTGDSGSRPHSAVILTPEAASPIVSALAAAFHSSESPPPLLGGEGWTLNDDPLRADGLAGGTFDDAGFPAAFRALATAGRLQGGISGPGTFRRMSFREPPIPAPSNLIVPSGGMDGSHRATIGVHRSRVAKLTPDVWVLELEFMKSGAGSNTPTGRAFARLSPFDLLKRCGMGVGPTRVTAEGPIVPSLRFDGLPLVYPT